MLALTIYNRKREKHGRSLTTENRQVATRTATIGEESGEMLAEHPNCVYVVTVGCMDKRKKSHKS